KLQNDSASPGNNKLYGTDGSGVKGWYDQPAGGGASEASRADMQAASASAVYASPRRMIDAPSAAKVWLLYQVGGGVILESENINSVTYNSTGYYTISFSVAFQNSRFPCFGGVIM